MRVLISIFWVTLWAWILMRIDPTPPHSFYIIAWAITVVLIIALEILLRRDGIK